MGLLVKQEATRLQPLWSVTLALALAGSVLAAESSAEDEGRRLLVMANRSMYQDVFEAVLVYDAPAMLVPEDRSPHARWQVKVARVWQKGSRFRMETLDREGGGPSGADVLLFDGTDAWVRTRDGRWTKFVDRGLHSEQAGFRRFVSGQWTLGASDLLLENYAAKLTDTVYLGSRIAGIVEVRPREPGSPWKKMWIDYVSGQILREELPNPQGKEVGTFLLAGYHPAMGMDDTLFASPASGEVVEPEPSGMPDTRASARIFGNLEEAQEAAQGGIFAPRLVPVGYRLIGVRLIAPEAYELVYWNGLGLIRWAVQQGKAAPPSTARPPVSGNPLDIPGPQAWGCQSEAGSQLLQWEPGRLVTVSGTVSLELLISMIR